MASRVRPTATTWAKNQVDPSSAAYHRTVPRPRKIVLAIRVDRSSCSRPSIQNARATSIAPMNVAISCALVVRPEIATNGSRTTAGNGGNGISARAGSLPAIGNTSWK